MQIKTPDGERNVASQAVAGTALGLAIPGTLSFLNQLVAGGIFNGGRATTECADTITISALTSELGKEKAECYADFKSLGQDPLTFIHLAEDKFHDIDDDKACEAAYWEAYHRINKET